MQLYFAIATILNHDGKENFYHNLTGVISVEEIIQNSMIITKETTINPCSNEELKVYEELMRKNPEEIDKLKDEMKK